MRCQRDGTTSKGVIVIMADANDHEKRYLFTPEHNRRLTRRYADLLKRLSAKGGSLLNPNEVIADMQLLGERRLRSTPPSNAVLETWDGPSEVPMDLDYWLRLQAVVLRDDPRLGTRVTGQLARIFGINTLADLLLWSQDELHLVAGQSRRGLTDYQWSQVAGFLEAVELQLVSRERLAELETEGFWRRLQHRGFECRLNTAAIGFRPIRFLWWDIWNNHGAILEKLGITTLADLAAARPDLGHRYAALVKISPSTKEPDAQRQREQAALRMLEAVAMAEQEAGLNPDGTWIS